MPANPTPSWFGVLQADARLATRLIGIARRKPNSSGSSLENAQKALTKIRFCLIDPNGYGLSESEIALLEQSCAEIDLALQDFSRNL